MKTLYEILGVAPDVRQDDLVMAYRRAAQRAHPDREGGSEEEFKAVAQAYETLRDPALRAEYDRTGKYEGQPADPDEEVVVMLAGLLHVLMNGPQKFALPLALVQAHRHVDAQIKDQERQLRTTEKAVRELETSAGFITNPLAQRATRKLLDRQVADHTKHSADLILLNKLAVALEEFRPPPEPGNGYQQSGQSGRIDSWRNLIGDPPWA